MNDYVKGFKDGFAAGLEEGKKLNTPKIGWPDISTSPYFELKDTCPKCGIKISGALGYVCNSINCPTYYKTWTGPTQYNEWSVDAVGALGSDTLSSNAVGANGPVGPRWPDTKEEQERLERYNQVWINGQWSELGN